MVGDCDRSASTCALADRDVLIEGRCTLDRGLIDLLMFPHGISTAIAGEGTLVGTDCLISGVDLHNIVLNERVGRPAIDGKKTDTRGAEGTTVGYRTGKVSRVTVEIERRLKDRTLSNLLAVSRLPSEPYHKVL